MRDKRIIEMEAEFVGKAFTNKQGCHFKVIEYERASRVLIEFQDVSKHRRYTSLKEVRSGGIKNPMFPFVCGVGYLGVGKYSSQEYTDDGVKRNTEAYEVWRGMLRRCYKEDHQTRKAPTYKDCSVNPIWHNFQNFAYWFYNHPYRREGWHLDKDIMVGGNKEYGPLRCTFVPHDVNVLTTTTKAKRGKYPIGVYFKKDVGKFRAQLGTYGGFQKLLIESHDPNECFLAYKVAKEQYMKEVGEQWEGKLDTRVIASLKNWVVKETD